MYQLTIGYASTFTNHPQNDDGDNIGGGCKQGPPMSDFCQFPLGNYAAEEKSSQKQETSHW